jgi:Zn-dependent protease with chaperone function
VVGSLAGLAIAAGLAYVYGIPWAAREVAERLPPGVETQLSEEGLKGMDRIVLRPSTLTAERQAKLREEFASLVKAANVQARLEFRDGQWIGANAFAIPGSIVVLTDQLVDLFDNDERVIAVLAHELGHVRYHHTTRNILQDSMVALLATMVLGDVSAVSSLATTIPTVLLHTGYTRDFEREADRYAFDLLKKTGRSPKLLGDALAQLEAEGSRAKSQECPVPRERGAEEQKEAPSRDRAADLGYLSTHPNTKERIQAAEDAAR